MLFDMYVTSSENEAKERRKKNEVSEVKNE